MFHSPVAATGASRSSTLCALIGTGIGGSRSRAMHEGEAAAMGLPLVYRILDSEVIGFGNDLGEFLDMLARIGFDGFNVTHPFKNAVLPLMDELSDAARRLGAVNTVLLRQGRMIGDNTDWSGYRAHFLAGLGSLPRCRVAMIGAGGAAAAVGYAHLDLGARHLSIFDPAAARAKALVERLSGLFPEAQVIAASTVEDAISGTDGVVQASPVGMLSHPGLPFDPALLSSEMWVSDIIYFPLETEILKAAKALGCATLDGGGMAVMQAAHAFALFTGRKPDTLRMLADFAAASARPAQRPSPSRSAFRIR
ncbi:shikimate 5-dehydrogenase [Novosphingobium barchaimii LL02]|uniref:Shikimate 5-dehydrogenase n=1 Tax=Novosphingobium barchaimii LL02 TaxID=1114963 RepID=A0A0J7XXC8_9SPHN|nr:shikimate dehydrogenase [Novosphingobium barchaimii]KMS56331.1 shikimate 5-dehydrogenase [Novosphingobium barchaimii LL02]